MSSGHALLAAGLALTLCSGCGPKLVRETIYDGDGVRVERRHTLKSGSPVVRGYAHPVTIAGVRVAHILATLNHEDSKGVQRQTIRSEHVYPLAEGMVQALATASPDDEIAAAAFPIDRRLGIFKQRRVTAFRAFVRGDELVLEFYSIESTLDRKERQAPEYRIPEAAPSWKPGFSLVAGEAQRRDGPRTLLVDWRDRYFAQPASLRLRDGKVQRRTILMEAEPAPAPEPPLPAAALPTAELQDAQIRALDEIDAVRRAGLISESEFRRRRRLVLEGRLEEAGYGAKPGD